ncbi:hypothetical protein X971_3219 [Agrobacterium tumefaciens LBA4213 (Ach5)]|nr:hypothetical protein X971_3219 [Agrobacterium tumefaciens LBA4213 (Ach5)]
MHRILPLDVSGWPRVYSIGRHNGIVFPLLKQMATHPPVANIVPESDSLHGLRLGAWSGRGGGVRIRLCGRQVAARINCYCEFSKAVKVRKIKS